MGSGVYVVSGFARFFGFAFAGRGGVESSPDSDSDGGGGGAFFFLVACVVGSIGTNVITGGGSGSLSGLALFFAPGGRPLPRLAAGKASSGSIALPEPGLSSTSAGGSRASPDVSTMSAIYLHLYFLLVNRQLETQTPSSQIDNPIVKGC